MILNKNELGSLLAQARVEAGLSQLELSRKLGYNSSQFVSNWERGLCAPPVNKLFQISKLLNVKPEQIHRIILDGTNAYLRAELKLPKERKKTKVGTC